jgi:DNA-directed RNA polymerase subunit RPC12/RpoP
MIKFSCKNCAQQISVPEVHAGKRGKCPKCGRIVLVPDKSTIVSFRCKNCGHNINVSKMYAGKRSKCPKCGAIIVIPELEYRELVTGDIDSNNLQINPTDSASELSLLKSPEEDRAVTQPTGYKGLSESVQVLVKTPEEEDAEAVGRRKLPWIIDIFLYPASIPGLTVLGIIIVIPLLISALQILLFQFAFSLSIIGFLINIVIGLYLYWYLAECIRDSALGGLRAPETIGTTPGFDELISRALDIIVCFIIFVGPPGFYFLYTHKTDTIFWALAGYAVFFFPMGLLAVIVFDSFSALNPIVLIGSIFSTFFQYCGLVFLFIIVGLLARRVFEVQSPVLGFVFYCLSLYLTFVGAHLLGRFYWKYREKLNWEV